MTPPPLPFVASLAGHGLILRGGFAFEKGEVAPEGPSGAPAQAVVLVGNGGRAMWPHFTAWRARQPAGIADPLDTWSREVIDAVAIETGARAVYPNDRPYLPFQQWAMRAEGLKPSPLGILIHREFGLWHAYRGALLLGEGSLLVHDLIQAPDNPIHPCAKCVEKPCLSICPVDAFSPSGYAVESCAKHVKGKHGGTCRGAGCLARNACPVGVAHRYSAEQQSFHMAAFLKNRV
ncbi:MAG TPA: hypothetical protein PKE65_04500 [Rhizobiaceae bacterium]|nr:hypothetical protein [Rhizobiaceae bacterium]